MTKASPAPSSLLCVCGKSTFSSPWLLISSPSILSGPPGNPVAAGRRRDVTASRRVPVLALVPLHCAGTAVPAARWGCGVPPGAAPRRWHRSHTARLQTHKSPRGNAVGGFLKRARFNLTSSAVTGRGMSGEVSWCGMWGDKKGFSAQGVS